MRLCSPAAQRTQSGRMSAIRQHTPPTLSLFPCFSQLLAGHLEARHAHALKSSTCSSAWPYNSETLWIPATNVCVRVCVCMSVLMCVCLCVRYVVGVEFVATIVSLAEMRKKSENLTKSYFICDADANQQNRQSKVKKGREKG